MALPDRMATRTACARAIVDPDMAEQAAAVVLPIMVHTHSLAGIVEVDGQKFAWELQREPQCTADGWKGMVVSVRQTGCQREALLEFPTPKRLLKGLPKGRSHLNDVIATRCVRAALLAGWDPASRGKPMVFTVDANGD